jgi:hypothetical protein
MTRAAASGLSSLLAAQRAAHAALLAALLAGGALYSALALRPFARAVALEGGRAAELLGQLPMSGGGADPERLLERALRGGDSGSGGDARDGDDNGGSDDEGDGEAKVDLAAGAAGSAGPAATANLFGLRQLRAGFAGDAAV